MTRWPVRRRALVQLTDGRALGGVLWAQRGPLLVLRGVRLHEPGCDPVSMDGEVVVERCHVLWIQLEG